MIDSIMSLAFVQDFIILAKPAAFNLYFALASIPLGFPFAIALALGKASQSRWKSTVSKMYIYAFRGSPLFIQFFMFYSIMLALNKPLWKPMGIDDFVLHPLFLGPMILTLNTSAYAAEIFYGALKIVPKGEIEAALSLGMDKWAVFKTVTWPNMLRIAWPSYTNEVVFLFHATTVVYFTLPVLNDQKDLMNKAGELFEKDYNVLLHFSVAAFYFVIISMVIFWLANKIQRRLNRHIKKDPEPLSIKPKYLR